MKTKIEPFKVAVVSAAIVVALWIAALIAIPKTYGPPKDAGIFGDMFGALNALFTGIALVGVVVTTWMQRVLLHEQLEASKEAERRHAEQMAVARSQVDLAREELAMERERTAREAEPIFVFRFQRMSGDFYSFDVTNHGGPIKRVHIVSNAATITSAQRHYVGRDATFPLLFDGPCNPTHFSISYVRVIDGGGRTERFVLDLPTRSIGAADPE